MQIVRWLPKIVYLLLREIFLKKRIEPYLVRIVTRTERILKEDQLFLQEMKRFPDCGRPFLEYLSFLLPDMQC